MKKTIIILGLLVSFCSLAAAKDWDDKTFHFRIGGGAGMGLDFFSEPEGSSAYYNQLFIDIQTDFLFSVAPGFRIGPSIKLNGRWDPFASNGINDFYNDLKIGMGIGLHIELRILYLEGGLMYNSMLKNWEFPDLFDYLYDDSASFNCFGQGYTRVFFEAGLRLPFKSKQAHGAAIHIGVRDTPIEYFNGSWYYIPWLDTLSAHLAISYTFKNN
jgi:hypothetical protein